MKRGFLFLSLSCFLICCSISLQAQELRLPRDSEKLITRAQTFWNDVAKSQRAKALDFVLPEKRDAFLSSPPMPILTAHVVGINLSKDPLKAIIRVEVDSSPDATSNRASWVITDQWQWKSGNWFANIGDPRDLLTAASSMPAIDVAEVRKDLEANLHLSSPTLEIGTIVQGQTVRLELPIVYEGKLPLALDLGVPYPGFTVSAEKPGGLSTRFFVSFDTSDLEGDLAVPLSLRFGYFGVSVERTITVHGHIFAPLTFRQVPAFASASSNAPVSIFVKNNTDSAVELEYITTNNTADIVKNSSTLPANQETEIILRLKPGEKTPILVFSSKAPVSGRSQFAFRLNMRS